MKSKTIKIVVAVVIVLLLFVYLRTKSSNYISKLGYIKEPNYYKVFFDQSNTKLKYRHTLVKDESNPISAYTYDDLNYGIVIFRKQTTSKDILKQVFYSSERKIKDSNKVYTGVIFDEFNYSFDSRDAINSIELFVEGFDNSFIKERSQDMIYLSFPINKTFAIGLNKTGIIDIQANKIPFEDKEYNELMMVKKNDFIYFIYLKPFKEGLVKSTILEEVINKN